MDIVAVLRSAGLKVDTRYFRGSSGSFNPVGVMYHHTAGADSEASLRLLRDGRTGIPGPLCQVGIRKDGTCVVFTNGRANHAGMGSGVVLNEVRRNIAVRGDARARGLRDDTNGNSHFVGLEIMNLGNGRDPYPQAQIDAMLRAGAAIISHKGWNNSNRAIHHREWTRRKVDMSWRGDLRGQLTALLVPPREYTLGERVLQRGCYGTDVQQWQTLLQRWDRRHITPSQIDGDYGPHTEAVTKIFQQHFSLPQSGMVGPGDISKMNQATTEWEFNSKRRYSMLIYAKRGTVDAQSAMAVHSAAPHGVFTQDLTEAQNALTRGETVVPVGGPAAAELPDAELAVVGSDAIDTLARFAHFARGGYKTS